MAGHSAPKLAWLLKAVETRDGSVWARLVVGAQSPEVAGALVNGFLGWRAVVPGSELDVMEPVAAEGDWGCVELGGGMALANERGEWHPLTRQKRRGRLPISAVPATRKERVDAWKDNFKREGGKRLTLWVRSEAHEALRALAARHKLSYAEVLERIVLGNAQRSAL
jgi:hypothetical protein